MGFFPADADKAMILIEGEAMLLKNKREMTVNNEKTAFVKNFH